jgi:hypothetical protein
MDMCSRFQKTDRIHLTAVALIDSRCGSDLQWLIRIQARCDPVCKSISVLSHGYTLEPLTWYCTIHQTGCEFLFFLIIYQKSLNCLEENTIPGKPVS